MYEDNVFFEVPEEEETTEKKKKLPLLKTSEIKANESEEILHKDSKKKLNDSEELMYPESRRKVLPPIYREKEITFE